MREVRGTGKWGKVVIFFFKIGVSGKVTLEHYFTESEVVGSVSTVGARALTGRQSGRFN